MAMFSCAIAGVLAMLSISLLSFPVSKGKGGVAGGIAGGMGIVAGLVGSCPRTTVVEVPILDKT